MKKYLFFSLAIFSFVFNTKAQDGLENILYADIADANKLTLEYLRPASEGFIYGMSNGWYHTAKVHKVLGFSLTIGANISTAPSSMDTFNVNALNLSNKITQNPATTPTVMGSGNAVTNAFEVTIPANSDPNINGGVHPELKRNFTMPNGFGEDLPLSGVPTPAFQLSVGLPWKLEASLRYVPEIGDDVSGNLFGMGLKKEITSWFGPMDKTPLHVSLMGAFTNMTVNSIIEDPAGNDINITNGLVQLDLNSYTVQAIASLNFPILNIYGGFGYVSGSSSLNVSGRYELQYQDGLVNYTRVLNNPIGLDYDISGFTTTAGLRLSLGFIKIFGSYTLQKYNTFNAGIAIGVR